MKSRLNKIKTTYNEQGNYDRDLYFKEQKIIYGNEIDYATRVDSITEQQFSLKPLEIGFLNSVALKDEQKFKDIKKIMSDYNKSIIQRGGAATNGLHLKKVVMDSMLKFMRLMLLAPDTGTKKVILDVAYHWFIKHLDPKSSHKSTKQLQKEIKQILIEKQLLPIDIVNKQLILNKVNEQLYPYRIKARTMYKELNDPRIELEHYNTHKLQFMTDRLKDNEVNNVKKKWIDTVKFPKIQPLPYSIYDPQLEKKEEQIQTVNPITEVPKQPQPQNLPEGQQPPVEIGPDGKPIIKQGDKQNVVDQQVDLDFGAPADREPEPEEPQQVLQDKKRGKLDPLLKLFVLQRIRAKQKQEVSGQMLRRKQMNQYNLTHEEDFLQGDHIRQWAKQRARLKTQISRKNQSMRGLDKIARGKQDQTVSFLQNDIDRIRMKSTISDYKRGITIVEVPPDKLNSQTGLSLFDRRRVRTQASQKPFSSILYDHRQKAEENQALDQISNVKQKFAKYKIYTPMDKIIKGLIPPQNQYVSEQNKIIWPNSQLISNPYIKVAKKKKKKKKK